MKPFYSTFFLLFSLIFNAQYKDSLHFDTHGQFKIIQFTDLHYNPLTSSSFQTLQTMQQLVRKERPQFIVITGDIITADPAIKAWHQLAKQLQLLQIPWTITFGNHDEDGNAQKKQIVELLDSYSYFYGSSEKVSGELNFSQAIYKANSDTIGGMMYFLDSHAYTSNPQFGTYDWIKNDQIQWYRNTRDQMIANYGRIPSIMFYHIPIREFRLIKRKNRLGKKGQKISSSQVNSGLFSAFLEKKEMMANFCGHDHKNNFVGLHQGIALGYGNLTGTDAYGRITRGARVIILKESSFEFITYITSPKKSKFFYSFP